MCIKVLIFSLNFIVVSLAKIDAQSSTVSNFAGGATVGASWTDKVMQVKETENTQGESQGQGEGVDDDEWVSSNKD